MEHRPPRGSADVPVSLLRIVPCHALAVLTHWGFVHIHPFMDGNGRLARLLMNYMLAGSGLPWTTIGAEERPTYFRALERAHVEEDFTSLAEFLRDDVVRSSGPFAGLGEHGVEKPQ